MSARRLPLSPSAPFARRLERLTVDRASLLSHAVTLVSAGAGAGLAGRLWPGAGPAVAAARERGPCTS